MKEITIENGNIFAKNGYVKSNIDSIIQNKIITESTATSINNLKYNKVIKSGLLAMTFRRKNPNTFLYKLAEGIYNFHLPACDIYLPIYMPELYFIYNKRSGQLLLGSTQIKIWPYYNAYSGAYKVQNMVEALSHEDISVDDFYNAGFTRRNYWLSMCMGGAFDGIDDMFNNIPLLMGSFLMSDNNYDLSCRASLNTNRLKNLINQYQLNDKSVNIDGRTIQLGRLDYDSLSDLRYSISSQFRSSLDYCDIFVILSYIFSQQNNRELMLAFWSLFTYDD